MGRALRDGYQGTLKVGDPSVSVPDGDISSGWMDLIAQRSVSKFLTVPPCASIN